VSLGLVPCEREGCGHRRGLHKAGGPCAFAGAGRDARCRCEAFVGELPSTPIAEEPAGRGVWIAVPDGFGLTIILTPIEKREETGT